MTGPDDIAVLREMVRLAESRRAEELEHIERVNKNNLALIAFSGSFLSLLISLPFDTRIVAVSGAILILSIVCSLMALRPRRIKGSIVIRCDIEAVEAGQKLSLPGYLLETADLADELATVLTDLSFQKKRWTIYAAVFLATALFATYLLYVMPQPGTTTVGL